MKNAKPKGYWLILIPSIALIAGAAWMLINLFPMIQSQFTVDVPEFLDDFDIDKSIYAPIIIVACIDIAVELATGIIGIINAKRVPMAPLVLIMSIVTALVSVSNLILYWVRTDEFFYPALVSGIIIVVPLAVGGILNYISSEG